MWYVPHFYFILLKMPRSKKQKGFRLATKKFFLTYPRCDLSKEELLDFLKTKGTIEHYIICIEDHKETADDHGGIGVHLHAGIIYNRRLDIQTDRYFDYKGFHPNIQKMKNFDETVRYIGKGDDFIQNGTIPPFNIMNGHNYIRRKADHREQTRDLRLKMKKDPVWPIILPDGKTEWAPMDKKRGLWIVGPASARKSTWFDNTFKAKGYRYFRAHRQPYPFEHYEQQQLLVFDDRDPTLGDITDCINMHDDDHSVGVTRNVQYYWRPDGVGEFWCVMIVLSNKIPPFSEDDVFKTRFDLIHHQ